MTDRLPIHETPTFRIYARERAKDRHGNTVEMQLCEELTDGRWEPFYTLPGPGVDAAGRMRMGGPRR